MVLFSSTVIYNLIEQNIQCKNCDQLSLKVRHVANKGNNSILHCVCNKCNSYFVLNSLGNEKTSIKECKEAFYESEIVDVIMRYLSGINFVQFFLSKEICMNEIKYQKLITYIDKITIELAKSTCKKMIDNIIIEKKKIICSGDASFSSNSNADSCTYAIKNCETNEVIDFEVIQKYDKRTNGTHKGSSKSMESVAFEIIMKRLEGMKDNIELLCLDADPCVNKIAKEYLGEDKIVSDASHFLKNIKKKERPLLGDKIDFVVSWIFFVSEPFKKVKSFNNNIYRKSLLAGEYHLTHERCNFLQCFCSPLKSYFSQHYDKIEKVDKSTLGDFQFLHLSIIDNILLHLDGRDLRNFILLHKVFIRYNILIF